VFGALNRRVETPQSQDAQFPDIASATEGRTNLENNNSGHDTKDLLSFTSFIVIAKSREVLPRRASIEAKVLNDTPWPFYMGFSDWLLTQMPNFLGGEGFQRIS
jgi:hypothetical protein